MWQEGWVEAAEELHLVRLDAGGDVEDTVADGAVEAEGSDEAVVEEDGDGGGLAGRGDGFPSACAMGIETEVSAEGAVGSGDRVDSEEVALVENGDFLEVEGAGGGWRGNAEGEG